MTDMKSAMLLALKNLPACTAAAFAREEMPLPIITVSDDAGRVLSQADGESYLEEYIAAVDIYAPSQEELEILTHQTNQALSQLGLRRIAQQDFYDEIAYAWRKHLRYRCVLQGDIIYQ